jgi:hypothetical protein
VQLAEAKAHIQKELHEWVWADGWLRLLSAFDEVFDEALTDTLDIEWGGDAMVPDFNRGRLIYGPEFEVMELSALQKAVWEKKVTRGCSAAILDAVVDELLTASFEFLGVKIKAAPKLPKNARGCGAWRDCCNGLTAGVTGETAKSEREPLNFSGWSEGVAGSGWSRLSEPSA